MKTLLWIASLGGLLSVVACATHEPEPHGGYYSPQEYQTGRHYSHADHYYWRDGYFDDAGQYHYYKW